MQASASGQGSSREDILFSVTHHNGYFSFDHSAFRSPMIYQGLKGGNDDSDTNSSLGEYILAIKHTQLFGSV